MVSDQEQTQTIVAPPPVLEPLNVHPHSRTRELRMWAVSFLLFLPFLIPTVCHFLAPPPGLRPTGFIQPDMPYYVGNAREHFDSGFTFLYGLPYSPFYDTPRLYFQPQTLLMGIVLKVTGMDPALLYLLFGAIFSVICARLALLLCERLYGLRTASQWLTAITFVWGGGVLCLLGTLKYLGSHNINDLCYFDPFDGMWFLNLGRNFIYPHEAYYHVVFLAAMLFLHARRWWPAFWCVALLSPSHPFTGVQLICIVLSWAVIERFWVRDRTLPIAFLVGVIALLLAHVGYYQFFLPHRSVEHQVVEMQWVYSTQDWTYEAKHFVPAYLLVTALAVWLGRTPALAGTLLSTPFARLALMWALVSFALANNEFALRPNIQPLHFTRGYIWSGIFILGAPALIQLLDYLLTRWKALGVGAVAIVMAVFWSDNAVFLATFHSRPNTANNEMWIEPGFRDLARFLSEPENAGCEVLTPDHPQIPFNHFPYLLTTYTPLRTWHSHPFNTPLMGQRHKEIVDLFYNNQWLPIWSQMKVLVVLPIRFGDPKFLTERHAKQVYSNESYLVYRIDPTTTPSPSSGGGLRR